MDALARALEFEAAKQSSRGTARIPSMDDSSVVATVDEAALKKIFRELLSEKTQLRCWNCDKLGHVRSRCKEKGRPSGATFGVGKLKKVDEKGQSSACT